MTDSSHTRPLRQLFDPSAGLAERGLLLWDLVMVALVSVNLAIIIVDAFYAIGLMQRLFAAAWPAGNDFYKTIIHDNFRAIDLAFVAVFVTDVLAGWAVAIVQRRHLRWFFYPFVHWYDVLGCIPVSGFRFLRVLRVIAILLRLQRIGVIDIWSWPLTKRLFVYYDIVVEEISDRVVIKMINGAQDEIRGGGEKITRRAVDEIFEPRRQQLVARAAKQLESTLTETYQTHRHELQRHVADIVHRGVARNAAVRNLERVPVFGHTLNHALNDAIQDAVNSLLDETVESATSDQFEAVAEAVIDQLVASLTADQGETPSEMNRALVEMLELIKEQVAVKQWLDYFETSDTQADDRDDRDAADNAGSSAGTPGRVS